MPDRASAAVELRDVAVVYGDRRALDGVSLSVPGGAVAGLLGANGSGKSTFISVVAGLRRPRDGDVRVLGAPPDPEVRSRIGVVFQESSLDPLMTVHETLWLHGRLFGRGGASLRHRIDELLARFGLAERARDPVRTLSGGLKRRLELARAVLPGPEVLLLDEPSTGLDPDSKRAFWELLRSERDAGMTLLLATNDVLEAERECDTVVFLHEGRIVAQGAPQELKSGLRHDAVRVECTNGRAGELSQAIAAWPGVGRVKSVDAVLHVTVDDVNAFVPRLFQLGGEGIHTIRIDTSTLEDAYFEIAGASLSKPGEPSP